MKKDKRTEYDYKRNYGFHEKPPSLTIKVDSEKTHSTIAYTIFRVCESVSKIVSRFGV